MPTSLYNDINCQTSHKYVKICQYTSVSLTRQTYIVNLGIPEAELSKLCIHNTEEESRLI